MKTRFLSLTLFAVASSLGAQPESIPAALDLELIAAMPEPSRLLVQGSYSAKRGSYDLTVEYVTQQKERHQALLIYAEPSHTLLFVQWSREPNAAARWSVELESPLVSVVGDFQMRKVKIPFSPTASDDGILVQFLTHHDQRITALSGRVGDLKSFEVESPVYD